MEAWGIHLISALIFAGVIDDLQSRKYHNNLFLLSLTLLVVKCVAFGQFDLLLTGGLAFLATLAAGLVIFRFGLLGAGDLKLTAIIAFAMGSSEILNVFMYALLWGVVFGVLLLAIRGQLRPFLNKIMGATGLRLDSSMPFTVPLFLAWLTHLTLNGGAM